MATGLMLLAGFSMPVAGGVFLGTLGAFAVRGLVRLSWMGVRALWAKYGHRIY